MKRRQAIFSLFGAASLASEAGAASPSQQVRGGLLRTLARVDPLPGEESSALAFLLSIRPSPVDPETEPALSFEP